MNYDQPRRKKDGGWHYTRMNDGQVWAIGYCPDHLPHASETEARECYTNYLLTERLDLHRFVADTWRRCQATEGCTELTNHVVQIDGWTRYDLCDAHRDREHVAALHGLVGNLTHS